MKNKKIYFKKRIKLKFQRRKIQYVLGKFHWTTLTA